jgi:PAS domain S-box-containing protein
MNDRLRILIATTLTGLVLIGGVVHQFVTELGDELVQLAQRGERQAQMLSTSTRSALEIVEGLRISAESKLAQPESLSSGYAELLGPVRDKNGYGLTGLPVPADPAASLNLTGLGELKGDASFQQELEVALSLDSMFRWVKNIYPETPWVYYLSVRRFMCVYPYIPFGEFFMNDAFYDMDLFAAGTPERNPERSAYVTQVYLDEAGQGQMVTFGAPVYQGNTFRAIVGFDLTLKSLSNSMQKYQFPGDQHYLLDAGGNVIALASDAHPQDVGAYHRPLRELRPGLFELTRTHDAAQQPVAFQNSHVIVTRLGPVPWVLITERADWDLYRAAARATAPLLVFIAVLLIGVRMLIRERQRHEQSESARSMRRFRRLLDSSTDMIAVVDPATARYLDVNQTLCEFMRLSREELLTRRVIDLSGEFSSMDLWNDAVARLREQGRFTLEDAGRRPDGTGFVAEVNAHYATDEEGEYIVGILRDIAERKRAEIALQKANQRFIAVLDGIDAAVYVADLQSYEVLYANPKVRERVGDVVGKCCWQAIYPGQTGPCGFCTNDRLLDTAGQPTGSCSWEFQNPADGRWYQCAARAIPWDDGRYVRLELAHDITERKNQEAERERLHRALQQSQKMEAIGQLTGGIAHDFNNILASMLGMTELARDRFGAGDARLDDYLGQILKAGGRARELIRQLLVYSRGDRRETAQPLQLVAQLQEVISMLRPMLPASIEIHTQWPEVSPTVTLDPLHLQQLVMNLSINARDAMRGVGVLSIAVSVQTLDGAECLICHQQVTGDWVCIEVADSGPGIAPDMLERMFQPFFTTKEAGESGGMGLAVVQGIVKTYGGHVLVDTGIGRGTRFDVLLPAATQRTEQGDSEPASGDALELGGKRLLVVEDEPLVRRYLKEFLLTTNADVTACANAVEALEAFRRSPGAFSLIITDQTMPGMSGVDMVREIRALNSDVPVVIFSGYADVVGKQERIELQIADVLLKPVMAEELERVISRVLDGA